jgi:hypothetical protein
MSAHENKLVTPKIMKLTHHYHNLIYILEFWERTGQQKPPEFALEVQRAHDALMVELEHENNQGGAYHERTEA